ncbi:MAG: MBL fold metallo-hydrolase [Thermodesulfobacteriota bacterium]
MKLQLIRNATMKIEYAGKTILTDPMLAGKYAYETFIGRSPNPLEDLPVSIEEVLSNVELCIVSHLHIDHFDPKAHEVLPKDLQIFCQPGDEPMIESVGFTNVKVLEDSTNWEGIEIIRTPAQHGVGVWIESMGKVSGFVFKAENEPTVYWAGDTVWYDEVEKIISEHKPDIIITHSSGAKLGNSEPIVMDGAQTVELCKFSPDSKVIAIHMESLDHFKISRADLRNLAEREGISTESLLIPADGEELTF